MDYKNCVLIGKNAFAIMDDQVVIGNFTEEEASTETYNDCYIFQDGKVIIKKDIVDSLIGGISDIQ